ncbi:MAG: hypothetical protein AB4372_37080, partial [Xenococcus sp. (in: cyanobacteria)]
MANINILLILENSSTAQQLWTVQGVGSGNIAPGNFVYKDGTYDPYQNLRVGITIDVGDDQIATQLRRDAGEDKKFYLFPDSHEFTLQQDANTLHIECSYSGNNAVGFTYSFTFPREEKPSTKLQDFI